MYRFATTIKAKLISGLAGLVGTVVVVAGVGFWGTHQLSNQVNTIINTNGRKVALSMELLDKINTLSVYGRNTVIYTSIPDIDLTLKRADATKIEYKKILSDLVKLINSDSDSTEAQALKLLQTNGDQALVVFDKVVLAGSSGDSSTAADLLVKQYQPVEKLWLQQVNSVIDIQNHENQQALTSINATQVKILYFLSFSILFSLALATLISWRLTITITRPINDAIKSLEMISNGDLTCDIKIPNDRDFSRFMSALALTQEKLNHLIKNIYLSVESIRVASTEVAIGNQDLSHRTEETSVNLQGAAAALEKLADTFKNNVNSAEVAIKLTSSSSTKAEEGGVVVSTVVKAMGDIDSSSAQIAEIIGVIDGIAFQTNILALNAAVEAARAGDHGRGFAVVASEVRNLAVRAAEAAKQIKELINNSVNLVKQGTSQVDIAGQTMLDLVSSVQSVSAIVSEISQTTADEADEIHVVSSAISELERMTQQNSALVEESAAAAESLKDQANNLFSLISVFKVDSPQESTPLLIPLSLS